MQLPGELQPVLAALRAVGRPRLVGGCVRDWLLGLEPKDFDVEVAGLDFERLHAALAPFGATDVVGRSFGVIKLRLAQAEYDFSLPRRESKIGAGHRGFAVAPDPSLTDAEAAARRDFTINAIAYDPFADRLIDPLGGVEDLRAKRLRHAGPGFAEDPLRVLRAFQLAARFDFSLAPATRALCRDIVETFDELPKERVWMEWEKWAAQATVPARGLSVLEQTGWLQHFPEIARLRGTQQEPQWHPEGDVLTHTQHCLNALVQLPSWQAAPRERRRMLTLAVLAHDFGKPATTTFGLRHGTRRWISPGHEAAGVEPAAAFLHRIGAPGDLAAWVGPLVANHLAHHQGQGGRFSDTHIRRLARRLAPATIDDLCTVMIADSEGRPPRKSPETLMLIEQLRQHAQILDVDRSQPVPLLLGRHLLQLGATPGPHFKPLLREAYEAQLDGAFRNEAGAIAWVEKRLHRSSEPA